MNPEAVRASHAAHGFFLELIDVALKPDWRDQIHGIAADSGWSHQSVEKRLRAIRYHLDMDVSPEAIAEWGAERTVSEWQKACNVRRGRAPGQAKYFKLKLPAVQVQGMNDLLTRLRTLLGCDDSVAMFFIETHFEHLEDGQIQYEAQSEWRGGNDNCKEE